MDLGLERAGFEIKWFVEKDEYCRRVLRKHWPEIRQWDDVRTWPQPDTSPVDVICGGFPCQDISFAGSGGGLGAERSGLWFDMLRIIRAIRPRFVLVENAPALLDRGLDVVLGGLAQSRYDAEWECLPASAFGCYNERDRLFILAYGKSEHGRSRYLLEARQKWRASLQSRRFHSMALAERGKQAGSRLECEPALDRMVSTFPGLSRQLGALGNSVVPDCAEWIGRRIIEAAQND